MTESETKIVQTEYGEATIETYDCDSCGNTVAYEETVEFTIGEREGRACSHCDNSGPVSFPDKAITMVHNIKSPFDATLWFDFFLPYLSVLSFSTIRYDNEKQNAFAKGFMRATVIWFLWALVGVSVWWLL